METKSHEEKLISTSGTPAVNPALLASCIHCGLCLPACPTYLATGREMESPRGRIHLINQWSSGHAEMTDRMTGHLESCLGCLGCQTACPSGVQYEEILNQTRPHLAARRSSFARTVMRFAFQQVLPRYKLLRLLGNLLRAWQIMFGTAVLETLFGKERLQSDSAVGKALNRLIDWEAFTPIVPPQVSLPPSLVPKGNSEKGAHTQLFAGCVMDVFYNHVNHASIRLMLKQGHSVDVPKQTCCGALAYHAGEEDIAIALAKKNIDDFGHSSTPIVVTSAGCGAMLKHYGHLLEGDREYAHKAELFSKRVEDITQFLGHHQFPDKPAPLPNKTTYHAACHLAHAQNVRKEPADLLNELNCDSENKLVPLVESEHCCGSAGIYNLLNTKLSLKVLDRKLDFIEDTGAETVVTTNPGCMIQLQAGIRERKLPVEVKHLIEVLDESYFSEPK
ncbi:4Fe-4S dicluster domain-containing protein [Candidatus Obscuribacterales bacterium]|nr:4Fe-4S dicluster domain-containing protein [Candidatus Obscuribacterales bacterium]